MTLFHHSELNFDFVFRIFAQQNSLKSVELSTLCVNLIQIRFKETVTKLTDITLFLTIPGREPTW